MTSSDLEFIASRKFQLEEVARIFRIPMHMIGELTRSTNNNIAQQAQEYINYTLTGYTQPLARQDVAVLRTAQDGLSIEFDYRALTQADMTSRINNWRTMVMSMLASRTKPASISGSIRGRRCSQAAHPAEHGGRRQPVDRHDQRRRRRPPATRSTARLEATLKEDDRHRRIPRCVKAGKQRPQDRRAVCRAEAGSGLR
jgi:hypothetical protein